MKSTRNISNSSPSWCRIKDWAFINIKLIEMGCNNPWNNVLLHIFFSHSVNNGWVSGAYFPTSLKTLATGVEESSAYSACILYVARIDASCWNCTYVWHLWTIEWLSFKSVGIIFVHFEIRGSAFLIRLLFHSIRQHCQFQSI